MADFDQHDHIGPIEDLRLSRSDVDNFIDQKNTISNEKVFFIDRFVRKLRLDPQLKELFRPLYVLRQSSIRRALENLFVPDDLRVAEFSEFKDFATTRCLATPLSDHSMGDLDDSISSQIVLHVRDDHSIVRSVTAVFTSSSAEDIASNKMKITDGLYFGYLVQIKYGAPRSDKKSLYDRHLLILARKGMDRGFGYNSYPSPLIANVVVGSSSERPFFTEDFPGISSPVTDIFFYSNEGRSGFGSGRHPSKNERAWISIGDSSSEITKTMNSLTDWSLIWQD